MTIRFFPYRLHFKRAFSIATGTRLTTDVVYVELEHEGIIGYGEAALPPYAGETQESVMTFFSQLNLLQFKNPLEIDLIMEYCDAISPGNHAAKAAVDIALHDLTGKLLNKPLYEFWNLDKEKTTFTCITIGMDEPEVVEEKVKEESSFPIYKVKLGSARDKDIISAIRKVSPDKPLMVDANQGWTDKYEALAMLHWLKEQNTLLIEQPFPKTWIKETAWLRERSPLPVFADEAVQRISDLEKIKDAYDGINIKLMKCTGLREARRMIEKARSLELKILLGCMSESSCAVTAAAHLSPMVDWADLDGPLLIKNDPFTGMQVVAGKIVLTDLPGSGAFPNKLYFGACA